MKKQITTSNTKLISAHFRTLIQPSQPLRRSRLAFLGFLMLFVVCSIGIAEDWPTYRSQITRSGITSETVGPGLFLQWKYIPTHRPKPAWPMPAAELPRMHNDNAYHVVIAGNNAYFGSCITNKVYSIDAAKGKVRWTFLPRGRSVLLRPFMTAGFMPVPMMVMCIVLIPETARLYGNTGPGPVMKRSLATVE